MAADEHTKHTMISTTTFAARESYEWSYKKVKQHFTSIDFVHMLKVQKSSIVEFLNMSVLLCNIKLYIHRA